MLLRVPAPVPAIHSHPSTGVNGGSGPRRDVEEARWAFRPPLTARSVRQVWLNTRITMTVLGVLGAGLLAGRLEPEFRASLKPRV